MSRRLPMTSEHVMYLSVHGLWNRSTMARPPSVWYQESFLFDRARMLDYFSTYREGKVLSSKWIVFYLYMLEG
jgi:hypothetical protein